MSSVMSGPGVSSLRLRARKTRPLLLPRESLCPPWPGSARGWGQYDADCRHPDQLPSALKCLNDRFLKNTQIVFHSIDFKCPIYEFFIDCQTKALLAIVDWNPVLVVYLLFNYFPIFPATRITKLKTNHPSYNATPILNLCIIKNLWNNVFLYLLKLKLSDYSRRLPSMIEWKWGCLDATWLSNDHNYTRIQH